MKALADTCREPGYTFGIHDQYRDYYYDASTFSMDSAVLNEDGGHPFCSIWYGGSHRYHCAKLAPDYVRRNYDTFERLGIRIEGAYLDVFSIVYLDECFSPEHPMTHEECAASRLECFHMLTQRGIIMASEETVDAMIPGLALCHHAPYFTSSLGTSSELFGDPIPLFNLVWYDCIVIPWHALEPSGGWGMPSDYDAFGMALINGGTLYCGIEEKKENISRMNAVLALHEKVTSRNWCAMISWTAIRIIRSLFLRMEPRWKRILKAKPIGSMERRSVDRRHACAV